MRKIIYISLLMAVLTPSMVAQKKKNTTIDGVKNISPEVYEYYKKCSTRLGEECILSMSDTLAQMALEGEDYRTMVASYCFKQEYWIGHHNLDSVRYWQHYIQKLALEKEIPLYYYHSWGRSVDYLLDNHYYNTALDELTAMQADIHKESVCMRTYLSLMERFYRHELNYEKALEYSLRLADYIESNHIYDFNHHMAYTTAITNLLELNRPKEAQQLGQRALRVACPREHQKGLMYCSLVEADVALQEFTTARQDLLMASRYLPEGTSMQEFVQANICYYSAIKDYETALYWVHHYENRTQIYTTFLKDKAYILLNLPGHEREAAAILETYLNYRDSVNLAEQSATIIEFATSMNVEGIQQNLLNYQTKTGKRFLISLIIALCIATGLSAYLIATRRSLRKSNEEKMAASIEKAAIEKEVNVARSIQDNLLHHAFPADPRVVLCAMLEPAQHVSGDIYDYKLVDDKLHFLIADISGKGMGASLYMTLATCTFRAYCHEKKNPAETMRIINRIMCTNNNRNIFITAVVGMLDLNTGLLQLCNAGHNPPIVLRRRADASYDSEMLHVEVDLPIGLIEDTKYSCQKFHLNKDDKLFVYTDGVSEAEDSQHQLFGDERLLSTLNYIAPSVPEEILAHVHKTVVEYAQGTPQADDITMLLIHYTHDADMGGVSDCKSTD